VHIIALAASTTESQMESHKRAVSQISERIKHFSQTQTPFRIYHGSTNSTRPTFRDPSTSVDVSALNNVLYIDTSNKIAIVEPNVPMDTLIEATLKHGLVPPVVPEFPGITVGGGFAGTAGESSSFKHGFLDATVERIEIVVGDGRVIECVRGGENEELLIGASGTLGTVGVLTRLNVRLIEARSHVELRYTPVTSYKEAVLKVRDRVEKTTSATVGAGEKLDEFIEAIMFSPISGAILTGRMVNLSEYPPAQRPKIITFSKPFDEWYYVHVKRRISQLNLPQLHQYAKKAPKPAPSTSEAASASESQSPPSEPEERAVPLGADTNINAKEEEAALDLIPLENYLFRYDRGGFWVGRLAFTYFHLPFIKPIRVIGDRYFHTRVMYHALHVSGLSTSYIIEDLAVPFISASPPPAAAVMDTTKTQAGALGNEEGASKAEVADKEQDSHTPAEQLLEYLEKDFNIFPLWLCPLKFSPIHLAPSHLSPASHPVLLNIGVWGPVPSLPRTSLRSSLYHMLTHPFMSHSSSSSPPTISRTLLPSLSFVPTNRAIESKLLSLGGTKWLYAHTFYSADEFWKIYDKTEYDAIREKYGSAYLPDVWEKVRTKTTKVKIRGRDSSGKKVEDEVEVTIADAERVKGWKAPLRNFWVFPALFALGKTMTGREYILKKNKKGVS
jgi:Delta24-sterol reductase